MLNTNEIISDGDFYNYSDINEFRKKISELKNVNFDDLDYRQIGDILFSHLSVIPSLSGIYPPETFNKSKFYRVRLNINEKYEDLKLIRTYSYPSPSFCTKNGRSNLTNKPVFYSSNHALTAVMECKPQVGDIGYLSVWIGNSNRSMKSGILLPRSLNEENEWYVLAKDVYAYAEDHFKKVAIQKSSFFHEALDFIANMFLSEQEPYPISSWIANELIYGSAWKDLIIYPSHENKSFTCNFAIHPNVVDNYLRFEKVIRFKVLEISEGLISLSTGRIGEMSNNNIEWRVAKEDELDFSNLSGIF